jgi:putative membrane protein
MSAPDRSPTDRGSPDQSLSDYVPTDHIPTDHRVTDRRGTDEPEGWRRLHPLTPFLRSTQLLYALVIGGFASLSAGVEVWILIAAAAAVGLTINLLLYRHYRYRLAREELLIEHGILFRKRRVIPRSRIQNVDLRAGLLQRVLGTTSARIETAGGQSTEAALQFVSREEGDRLRQALVETAPLEPAGRAPAIVAGEEGEAVAASAAPLAAPREARDTAADFEERRVSVLDLIIAGATANRAGLLVGALLGGNLFLDVVPTEWILGRVLPAELMQPDAAAESLFRAAQRDLGAFLLGAFVLALFFALAGWGASVAASLVRYFDFTFARHGGELRVSYGLFTRRERGFRRSRVQNVQVEEPILRRWLNLASLTVQTAGYGPGVKTEERVETLTPITRRDQIGLYLSALYPDFDWRAVEWRPSHPRSRRRLFIRRALVVVALAVALAALVDVRWLILLVGLVPAWLLAAAHYRQLGHAREGSYVLVREGLWTRRTHIIPVRKIQALHLRQSPFQRRLHLGTLSIETAGLPFELRPPRSLDLGIDYGRSLMDGLALEVTATGLTF